MLFKMIKCGLRSSPVPHPKCRVNLVQDDVIPTVVGIEWSAGPRQVQPRADVASLRQAAPRRR